MKKLAESKGKALEKMMRKSEGYAEMRQKDIASRKPRSTSEAVGKALAMFGTNKK